MQKIKSIKEWLPLLEGSVMTFPGDARRLVLEINSPADTSLYLSFAEDGLDPQFLAHCKAGRETVEVYVPGPVSIMADGNIYLQSAEKGLSTVYRDDDPLIFTKIRERRVRNPQLEALMYEAERNIMRRVAAQMDERDAKAARIAAQQKRRRELEELNRQASEAGGDKATPAKGKSSDQQAGGTPPASADDGKPASGKQPDPKK